MNISLADLIRISHDLGTAPDKVRKDHPELMDEIEEHRRFGSDYTPPRARLELRLRTLEHRLATLEKLRAKDIEPDR